MKDNTLDDYLNDDNYLEHPIGEDGFSKFFKEDTTTYYFACIENGQLIFKSEGYTTESGRDNGIKSVKKNAPIEKRYKLLGLEDEKWCLSLRAGNHKEVAITRTMDSEEAAWSLLPSKRASSLSLRLNDSRPTNVDEYLSFESYKGHERTSLYPDFCSFTHEGEYFFAMLAENDDVLLRSEGYIAEAAREKGIRSVIKNRALEKRYRVVKESDDYLLILRAGNNKEIGRSCSYESEAVALAAMFAWKPKEMPLATTSSKGKDDDYLQGKEYEGYERNPYYPEFSTFDKDSLHYFAMLNDGGNVLLRSEGYTAIAARDKGIHSVIKNKDIEKRKKIIERFGYYFLIIKAGNHQEIARSCALQDEAAALALFTPAVALTTIPVVISTESEVVIEEPVEVEIPESIIEIEEEIPVDTEELESDILGDEDSDAIGAVPAVGALVIAGAALVVTPDPVIEVPEEEELDLEFLEEETHPEENDNDSNGVIGAAPIVVAVPIVGALVEALVETFAELGEKADLVTSSEPVTPPDSESVIPPVSEEPPKRELGFVPPVAAAGGGSGCVNWKILLPLILLLLALLWFMDSCEGCKEFGTNPSIGTDIEIDKDIPTEMDINIDVKADADTSANLDADGNPIIGIANGNAKLDADGNPMIGGDENSGDANDKEGTSTNINKPKKSIKSEAELKAEKEAAAAAKTQAERDAISANTAKIGLRSVYYDYDKWDLRDDAKTELDKMIDILKSDAQLRGEFLGHTDTRGSQKYNDRLSRKRAEAALNYVVSKGITKRRLSWRKFSEDIPKAQNDVKSEQKLQINRRVDLRIRKSGKILYDTQKSVIEMK
jgi:uncharacterized protein YegP (UPF0339 family)/outer membrane protein OmpA-like peptidoglycan-associated protein